MCVRTFFAVLLLAPIAALAGCASSQASEPSPTTAAPVTYIDKTEAQVVTIQARDNLFTPANVKVRRGTTIVFENGGRNDHNVISADEAFHDIETAAFAPGAKKSVVFTTPGTHQFYCSLHGTATNGMHGSVLVVG